MSGLLFIWIIGKLRISFKLKVFSILYSFLSKDNILSITYEVCIIHILILETCKISFFYIVSECLENNMVQVLNIY